MVDRDAGTMSLTVTRAALNTDTPIVGVELAPYIVTRKSDGTSTTEDIGRENPHEGSCVRYRWFRSGEKTAHERVFGASGGTGDAVERGDENVSL